MDYIKVFICVMLFTAIVTSAFIWNDLKKNK